MSNNILGMDLKGFKTLYHKEVNHLVGVFQKFNFNYTSLTVYLNIQRLILLIVFNSTKEAI